jgi:hypothetical protein
MALILKDLPGSKRMGAWLYRNKNQNSQTPSSRSNPFFSSFPSRLLKNGHLLRYPHPSSLRRTAKYASLLGISGAPVNGISQTQLASACLREAPPCGAKAGPFLSNLEKMTFSLGC